MNTDAGELLKSDDESTILELATRLLNDSADYFETLYQRHSIDVTRRGIDPYKLRKVAASLTAGAAQEAMKWVQRENEECFPAVDGWYRVMVSGDSESIDGHQIYAFDDYETWAQFKSHAPDEGGSFTGIHDEDEHTIFAYCGPITLPEYTYEQAASSVPSAEQK